MRLYIIRHADPDYENNTLTPAGHLEAQALARRLATAGLDYVYTSPLARARLTAQYTADLLKLTPQVEEWTAELSDWRIEQAPWGRLMAWDLPGEIVRAQETFPTHDTWHLISPLEVYRAEFETIQRNSDAFICGLGYERQNGRYRCLRPNRDRIAIFCHNGFGITWLAHLLEIPLALVWSGFWLAPSSVTTILFDERSETWAVPRCLGLGDVSHLYEARLPVQRRGIKANFY